MCKILLIEDNEGDILLMKEAFEELDSESELEVIKDGEEASNYIKKRKGNEDKEDLPDIILLDINLPKVNGHELLHQIRMNEHFNRLPVIVLTTSSAEKDIQKAYENAANCYITKPTGLEEFFSIVGGIHQFWLKIATLPT